MMSLRSNETLFEVREAFSDEVETYTAEQLEDLFREFLETQEDEYDEMLDECYPAVEIGSLSYLPSQVLCKVDPIAYRCGLTEWADAEAQDIRYQLERMSGGDEESWYGYDITCIGSGESEESEAVAAAD